MYYIISYHMTENPPRGPRISRDPPSPKIGILLNTWYLVINKPTWLYQTAVAIGYQVSSSHTMREPYMACLP